ncbi:hypothetical protein [Exiguobacterium alkaliphilum]|uniref:Uncharacterized protein n=1 Tax=Exiguobacterium alkaliphilum TaxID=1428684 RepID=A0ABT2L2C9_9BACL|nr:hypothetical protein [Exiguobacterium alkaliphilum]MCT4796156.1 hypothetical protein [Exiguobacterium alkaliphilum]
MDLKTKWNEFSLKRIIKPSPYWIPALIGTFSLSLIVLLLTKSSFRSIVNNNYFSFQLATTLILATVGIWTVINTTISAKSAAKSLELNLQNKLKDETALIVLIDKRIETPYAPPSAYEHPYTTLNSVIHQAQISAEEKSKHLNTILEDNKKLFTFENSIKAHKNDYFIDVTNIGKGPGMSVKYRVFLNNWMVYSKPYTFYSSDYIRTFPLGYKIEFSTYSQGEGITIDNRYEIDMDVNGKLLYSKPDYEFNHYLPFQNKELVSGEKNFLISNNSFKIELPTEFIVIAKHFAIITNLIESGTAPELVYFPSPQLKVLLEYKDELTLKHNRTDFNQTHNFEYIISIDENSIVVNSDTIKFDLKTTVS